MTRLIVDIILAVLVPIPVYYLGVWQGRERTIAKYYSGNDCQLCEQRSRYAYYTFTAHKFVSKVPFIGKWFIGIMVGFWYSQILKTGANYGKRRNASAKAEMSRL